MAELNFNALARPGPQGFMQGYEQGQQQRMAQETNQIAQDTSRFKLDELKRDREEMLQLQAQLKSLGQDPNPRTFLQTLKNTGRPEYVKMAIEGMQKLDDLDAYANLGKGGAMPTGAPAVSSNRVNELNAAPGVEVFKVNEQPVPVNALAAPAAAAMPVNALAPQPNADQIAPTQQRIRQLLDFARSNPRMAAQAMSEARILQDQLELFSKRGQNEPADAVMMERLGYPPTQEGFKAYQDAKRAERPDLLLNPEVEAQRIRMALASRPPAPPRAEQPLEKVVDPITGKIVFASREQALQGRMTPAAAMESLNPKEIQAREAKYPAATLAVKTIESSSDRLASDLDELAKHPGLSGISGLIYGNTPAITKDARVALEKYKSILARGGFSELQSMRAASPTGGALGNVSNQENQYLRDAFAAIGRSQDTADLKTALQSAANVARAAKQRVREAYDMTYDYKTGRSASPAAAAPRIAPPAGFTPDQQ